MKPVIKIVFALLCSAMMCLSPAFAQEPLNCTVSVADTLDFGTFSVFGAFPEPEIDMTISCNRNPRFPITVWISLGSYPVGIRHSRQMKRTNPATENYIEYELFDQYQNDYLGFDTPGSGPPSSCFINGKCIMKIKGKLWYTQMADYHAGQYSDPYLAVRLRYLTEY